MSDINEIEIMDSRYGRSNFEYKILPSGKHALEQYKYLDKPLVSMPIIPKSEIINIHGNVQNFHNASYNQNKGEIYQETNKNNASKSDEKYQIFGLYLSLGQFILAVLALLVTIAGIWLATK